MATILLIEPDAKLGKSYSAALGQAGHHVLCSATAQDAIIQADAAQSKPDSTGIDAVILELQLVGHSGIEFLYEFRSYTDWRDVPVVIFSHTPPAELAASAKLLHQRLKVSAFLYKPHTTLRGLLASVDKVLAGQVA